MAACRRAPGRLTSAGPSRAPEPNRKVSAPVRARPVEPAQFNTEAVL